MKNRFLSGIVLAILAGLFCLQASASQSQVVTELEKIKKEVTHWVGNNPKDVKALGLGAVGGGITATLKLKGKRALQTRALRGAAFGALACATARYISENMYKEEKKVEEVSYQIGAVTAAIIALICG